MSSKRHKIETEITKNRNESNWPKVEESAKLLSKKYGPSDGAVMMLEAEVKLETYLQEHPPRQENVSKSRRDLSQLKIKLQECASLECKDSLFNLKEESGMLLCKLLYAQGNTKQCLSTMEGLTLGNADKDTPCYKLKLMAEVYATKGLSLEQLHIKSGEEMDIQKIIECYNRSNELSSKYVKELERVCSGMQTNSEPTLGYAMELAFQRGPFLSLKNCELETVVENLRNLLQSKTTSSVQQTLARDLATILLRAVCDETYHPPGEQNGEEPEGSTTSKVLLKRSNNSPTTMFTISPTDKPFSPTDLTQELILLLIISEAMLNTDPLLDMSPEYAEARGELLKDSRTLYDLLAIALVDLSRYDIFSKSIEASLKYAYNEFHIWYQYALSLVCGSKFDRAMRVLMECTRIQPENPAPLLLAAKISYENLGKFNDGLEFAKKALCACTVAKNDDDDIDDYLCAAHLAVGIGHSYQCVDGSPMDKVKEHRSKAILHLSEAHNIDPMDVKPQLFLALELALERRIKEATVHIKEALEMQPQDLNCLHLLVILLTASKQMKEAFAVLEIATKFYPENINLLVTKCKLQMHIGKTEDALRTCNHMASIYKTLHEACFNNTLNAEAMIDRMTSDGLSVTNQSIGNDLDIMDGGGGSFIGSVAVSRAGHALSDIESSLGDINPKHINVASASPSILHAHIWLLTAEVYLSLDRYDEAGQCIQEASVLFPISHLVLYTRGRLAQCRGDLIEAASMYENAITINPKHHKSMSEWAKILIEQQKFEFAKKLLQDAVKLCPMSHEVWLCLGDVLQELGDVEGSVECTSAAINIEATSPVVPFTTLTREL